MLIRIKFTQYIKVNAEILQNNSECILPVVLSSNLDELSIKIVY
jgi:hypothetical protein